jgi:hypothetical protein
MNLAPDPSTKKPAQLGNASSATCHLNFLIKFLRRITNDCSLLRPKEKLADEERQPDTVVEEISDEHSDNASIFKASSRDGTKVRTRKYTALRILCGNI